MCLELLSAGRAIQFDTVLSALVSLWRPREAIKIFCGREPDDPCALQTRDCDERATLGAASASRWIGLFLRKTTASSLSASMLTVAYSTEAVQLLRDIRANTRRASRSNRGRLGQIRPIIGKTLGREHKTQACV
jgi:hypothetical protein